MVLSELYVVLMQQSDEIRDTSSIYRPSFDPWWEKGESELLGSASHPCRPETAVCGSELVGLHSLLDWLASGKSWMRIFLI